MRLDLKLLGERRFEDAIHGLVLELFELQLLGHNEEVLFVGLEGGLGVENHGLGSHWPELEEAEREVHTARERGALACFEGYELDADQRRSHQVAGLGRLLVLEHGRLAVDEAQTCEFLGLRGREALNLGRAEDEGLELGVSLEHFEERGFVLGARVVLGLLHHDVNEALQQVVHSLRAELSGLGLFVALQHLGNELLQFFVAALVKLLLRFEGQALGDLVDGLRERRLVVRGQLLLLLLQPLVLLSQLLQPRLVLQVLRVLLLNSLPELA